MFSTTQSDTSSGGFTHSQSSDATPSPAKSRALQGLVSVTVKQILEASYSGDEKSNFVINGAEVTNVMLVGMVSEIDQRVTDIGLTIDDGTSQMVAGDGGEAIPSTTVQSGSNGTQISTLTTVAKQFSADVLKDCDQLVLECLQQSSSIGREKGMHVDEIGQQLKAEDSSGEDKRIY